MKKTKAQERTHTILFMFVITVVCITAVSGTYLSLKDIIDRNQTLSIRKAILGAAGVEMPSGAAETDALYRARVVELAITNKTDLSVSMEYQIHDQHNQPIAIVIEESGAGLWGTVRAVIGFMPPQNTLTGIRFTEQNETPGLGARIEEQRFKQQFIGKLGPFSTVPEGEPTQPNEFDAITGATITSTAVRDILNRACERAAQRSQQLLPGNNDATQ